MPPVRKAGGKRCRGSRSEHRRRRKPPINATASRMTVDTSQCQMEWRNHRRCAQTRMGQASRGPNPVDCLLRSIRWCVRSAEPSDLLLSRIPTSWGGFCGIWSRWGGPHGDLIPIASTDNRRRYAANHDCRGDLGSIPRRTAVSRLRSETGFPIIHHMASQFEARL
jgi:hypothetical protein